MNKIKKWWWFLLIPLWAFLIVYHFGMCMFVMLIFRKDERRKKFYEYYAPWGWGKA